VVGENGSECRDSGMGTISLIAENQCHRVARRNVADVRGFRHVLADTAEGDAWQQFGMPQDFAPLFGRRHLDGYGFLGVDIDMNVPSLVSRFENSARVVIGRVQAGTFIARRQPVKGRLLGAPSACDANAQGENQSKREQAPSVQ
jgi:hypothetical protein